ncbi:MAG: hypothetical protein GFH27_549281n192 [Chloroflexi bacterium AL-W]|nr:hypothetical protein [Chloroflexi bacterium AL-N1]NOK66078.1 hypothetical protein [Chloroflexi bacterium AL-N10]NOK72959.1 hypothetical protein [Chloroflexi bacterium AL-N5]NOK79856.1 hypothetical protein [Chloroflexi bacterium AL-W]NOK88288.1 hypothetical protein [Chloroflexi bacterium AL-N15]
METLKVAATLDALTAIRDFINGATHQAGLDEHASWQVQLAIDEAATNVIQHGYNGSEPGVVELSWQIDDDELSIVLRDWGRQFNPDDIPTPDIESPLEERQVGGLGLYLMQQLMDNVHFEFDTHYGNLLTMTKRLQRSKPAITEFQLHDRLDAVSTDHGLAAVRAAIAVGTKYVLLDMTKVTFLNSSGLRALLLLRKELLAQGGELRLCGLQSQVYEVFNLTGFTQVFTIHPTREEAVVAFEQGHP